MADYSGKQALMTMRIIHFAMMGGLAMFGAVTFYLITSGEFEGGLDNGNQLLMVAGVAGLGAIAMSFIVFKQLLAKIQNGQPLREKMTAYQTAHIVRCAVLEGAGLFATVVCLLTREPMGFATLAVILGIFFLAVPSVASLERDLNLTSAEKNELI